jgi:hypothetical protein
MEESDLDVDHARKSFMDQSTSGSLKLSTVIRIKKQAHTIKKKLEYKKASKRVLLPNGNARSLWDFCNLLVLIYSVFEVPYSISFQPSSCASTESDFFNLGIDAFFMSDVLLNFFTAYLDEEVGVMEVQLKSIALNYLKRWFCFDVLSSLPWDRIVCTAIHDDGTSIFSRIIKVFRFVKILRFFRMIRVAASLQEALGHWIGDSLRLIKFLGVLLFCGHISACIWFAVIDLNHCIIPADLFPSGSVVCGCDPSATACQEWNWLIKYDATIFAGNATAPRYLASVYYAVVTLTTLGYGDVLPTNQAERGVSSALALSGALAFSFLISNISRLVSQGNTVEAAIAAHLAELNDLCAMQAVPRDTRKATRRLASYMLARAPHLLRGPAGLEFLPRAHRAAIVDAMTAESVGRVPLFRGMDLDCRARLAGVLRPCLFHAGDDVFRALDVATELYWVVAGEVLGARAFDCGSWRARVRVLSPQMAICCFPCRALLGRVARDPTLHVRLATLHVVASSGT